MLIAIIFVSLLIVALFAAGVAALVSLAEFILNREYSKFGKILPGKSKHKFLVITPKDVVITSVQFLGQRIMTQ